MPRLVRAAARNKQVPPKKVKAVELFTNLAYFEQVQLVCNFVKQEGSFGAIQETADRILTGKYEKSTTGGKKLQGDLIVLFDTVIENLRRDKKNVLDAMMKV